MNIHVNRKFLIKPSIHLAESALAYRGLGTGHRSCRNHDSYMDDPYRSTSWNCHCSTVGSLTTCCVQTSVGYEDVDDMFLLDSQSPPVESHDRANNHDSCATPPMCKCPACRDREYYVLAACRYRQPYDFSVLILPSVRDCQHSWLCIAR